MTVSRTDHIRPGLVDRSMDHESGRVQESHFTTIDDVPTVIHLYQVTLPHQRERHTKRVHPERGRVNRIAERNVTGNALIKPVFAEDAKGSRETTFQVFTLLVLICKFRRARELWHLNFGLVLTQAGLKRCLGRGLGGAVGLRLSHCCRRWRHGVSYMLELIKVADR